MSGVTRVQLAKLLEPFDEKFIEWRLQSAGKSKAGTIWGQALAYINNRAIMDRLDEVVGPENWQNEYEKAPNGENSTICGISILVQRDGGSIEWVTKWDGADNSDIEAIKGGLSNSMKRAAVQWGIGRYLYDLETAWVTVTDEGRFKNGKTKDGEFFSWNPPTLPTWALPESPLAKIARLSAKLTNESTIEIKGEMVNTKHYLKESWDAMKKDDTLAHSVAVKLEASL